MKRIFVNLKRFDVPEVMGGICPMDQPDVWIQWVMDESINNGLGQLLDMEVVYILPESLMLPAVRQLQTYSEEQWKGIHIASQYVYREDVAVGGNFGAFSTCLPAAVVKSIGATWTMIGHSEERKDKIALMSRVSDDGSAVKEQVEKVLNEEVHKALERDLDVIFCVGETAEEKGQASLKEQTINIKNILKAQLVAGLEGVEPYLETRTITIGYEPIWAIGPGKTPPDQAYIAFVSDYIKEVIQEVYASDMDVVYGGGLKEANAESIAAVESISGGLVALTTFTVPPKFEPEALKNIIDIYNRA